MPEGSLIRVEPSMKESIADLFAACFQEDPLYLYLIPDHRLREKLLPIFFRLYVDMIYEHGILYADSPAVHAAAAVFGLEDLDPPPGHSYLWSVIRCGLRLSGVLARADPSLRTLFRFGGNLNLLSSSWTTQVPGDRHVHLDLIAVSPECRGKGLAGNLLRRLLAKTDALALPSTVETHNPANVTLYQHYGYQMFQEQKHDGGIREYCMVRPAGGNHA